MNYNYYTIRRYQFDENILRFYNELKKQLFLEHYLPENIN